MRNRAIRSPPQVTQALISEVGYWNDNTPRFVYVQPVVRIGQIESPNILRLVASRIREMVIEQVQLVNPSITRAQLMLSRGILVGVEAGSQTAHGVIYILSKL